MRKLLISLLTLLFFANCWSQEVRVIDAKTGRSIEGVLLITKKVSTQTNQNGKASLNLFSDNEKILFKHSSFLQFTSTKQKIIKSGGIVLLLENPVRLEEIVVSVNRWEQSTTEIPYTIKTIKADQVLHYNPQSTADLLGTKGGIFIQKSQMGGGSPMIRGFAANRVLIVVDGIRMNNAIFRSGNLHNVISLDANSIENTEIIFGPGSVIYGSDALGGVMSFNTVSPRLATSSKKLETGKIMSRFSSANLEKTVHATYNIGTQKWAAVFSSTYTDFDDLRMGTNGPDEYLRTEYVLNQKFSGIDEIVENLNPRKQIYTGYKQFNVLGKLRFRPSEKLDLVLSAHHSQTGNIPRYDRLIQYKNNNLKYAQWYYGPQKWSLFSAKLNYDCEHALFDKISIISGYQLYEESRNNRKLNTGNLLKRKENLGIFSFNIDFGKTFDSKNQIYYGAEAYSNRVHSSGTSVDLISNSVSDIASRYPDNSSYNSFAGYYSFKYNLDKQFIIEAGSRFTVTVLRGNFDTRFYNFPVTNFNSTNSAFNGNLGLVWHPTKEWQINLHSSTGFRAPNIDDVAKVFDSEPGNVVVPNPDLKPEYARNLELSVIRSYSEKARLELTGFYTWLKNAMVRRDFSINGNDSIVYDGVLSKVEALVNAESASIWGANISFEYLFDNKLRTRNDLNITTGKDSEGLPMRHVPPTFGSTHFIYENQKIFVDFYINYSGKFDYEQLAKDEQEKPHLYIADENGHPYSPSWWTVNLKTNYKFNQKITLACGVENILNKRYRTYSSGIAAPGINFVFSGTIQL